ncbi:hypothetical protein E2986_12066 [Frieseomelitta varia]|uniref:Uncharacterized protein n=1 Tax=Frieseomelitta varia TaxID=561572 RepID=A0A833R5M0_9HYME|nr:hypothetical protein E2986_12066 [Frieseomelitta varia]
MIFDVCSINKNELWFDDAVTSSIHRFSVHSDFKTPKQASHLEYTFVSIKNIAKKKQELFCKSIEHTSDVIRKYGCIFAITAQGE